VGCYNLNFSAAPCSNPRGFGGPFPQGFNS
jgi:hypothetical protein